MLDVTAEQLALYASGGKGELKFYAYYDDELLSPDALPSEGASLTLDTDLAVQLSGSFTVASPEGLLVPRGYRAPLSPFGVRLRVEWEVNFGIGYASTQIGWLRLDEIPKLQEQLEQYSNGVWAHRGARLEVNVTGLLQDVEDDLLEAPLQPTVAQLASSWDYLALVAGMPIERSLGDAALPTQIVFNGSRLDACYLIAENIGGILYETDDGTLSVRPFDDLADLDAPVWEADYGPEGLVVNPPRAIGRQDWYNVFIAKSEAAADQAPLVGRAAIDAGPLREGGPMRRRQLVQTSKLWTTQAAVNAAALAMRDAQLAGTPTETELLVLTNPALQGGDVVQFGLYDRDLAGVVKKWTIADHQLMKLTLQLPGEADPWA